VKSRQRPSHRRSTLAVAFLAFCVGARPAHAQTPARLRQFLEQSIGLDGKQIAAVERGEPLVIVLPTQNNRDVAVFGIVTTRVSRETFVRQTRDFQSSLRNPNRLHFGIFGDPAAVTDAQALTIGSDDANDLRNCRPGDCKFKLPPSEMGRVHERVNWSAPDVQAQVTNYTRQRLVDYVTAYRARGDSALVDYDGAPVVRASDAFAALLGDSPYVYQYVPSLQQYLASYPRTKLDGASEVVYWSEDAAPHLRRILSVTHAVLYSPPELPGTSLIASKQIYANHYFEGALDLTTVVDRPDASGSAGSYLLVLRRYRFDYLPSGGLLNIRKRAMNGLKDQLLADISRNRDLSERGVESQK
jgi:hypothetical protein